MFRTRVTIRHVFCGADFNGFKIRETLFHDWKRMGFPIMSSVFILKESVFPEIKAIKFSYEKNRINK